MSTPNLQLAHIVAAQNQKEVTANAALDGLDVATCRRLEVPMGDGDVTVAALAYCLVATGALAAGRNLIVPSNPKPYLVSNQTSGGQTVTVRTAAGAGVAIAADGSYRAVYCDGTNVVRIS